jgi:hypothetical protein
MLFFHLSRQFLSEKCPSPTLLSTYFHKKTYSLNISLGRSRGRYIAQTNHTGNSLFSHAVTFQYFANVIKASPQSFWNIFITSKETPYSFRSDFSVPLFPPQHHTLP